jgi:hypothetical protein
MAKKSDVMKAIENLIIYSCELKKKCHDVVVEYNYQVMIDTLVNSLKQIESIDSLD